MTNPREAIAKMTPHGIQVGMPFGGKAEITAQDIAHAMAKGKTRPEYGYLLLFKYALDEGAWEALRPIWRNQVTAISNEYAWRSRSKDRMQSLADLTLIDYARAGRCRQCDGVGSTKIDAKIARCGKCKGSGAEIIYDREKGRVLGISVQSYQQTWEPRYQLLIRELTSWEDRGIGLMRAAMKDDE